MKADAAVAVLVHEHRVILRVVDGLKAGASRLAQGDALDVGTLREAAAFMTDYADRLHHAKEEDLLFPALVAHGVPLHGCPIDALLHEHRQGRELAGRFSAAIERYAQGVGEAARDITAAIEGVVRLYPGHIWKEDDMVFPMVERLIPKADRDELLMKFEAADAEMDSRDRRRFEDFAERISILL